MKRALFALVAMTVVASFSGCCCTDRLFCGNFWCRGGGCGSGCGDCGGCDSCGCDDGGCGCDTGGGDCGCGGGGDYAVGGGGCGCGGGGGGGGDGYEGPMPLGRKVHGVREDMRYAQGPPASGVAYPYYTTRGPRDFLARKPQSIGP